jgi:hypothetical protein
MAMSTNESVATSKPKINAYVSEEINKAIEVEMAKERRSKSQMVELLLEEALKARGYQFSQTAQQDNQVDESH